MSGFRSGFVSLVGRPNVGKSTLVNRIVGTKVAIVSDRPQTTRTQIRGVRTTADSQLVLLDTPGIHKPRTLLGERTNDRALSTLGEVDVVCFLIEATSSIGPGDRFIAGLVQQVPTPKILVVNKTDLADKREIGERLAIVTAELGEFDAYVPLSGLTGEGVDALVGELESRIPEGPEYYPGASSPTSPRPSSPPSSCGRSSCGSPARSCRTRSRWWPRRSRPATRGNSEPATDDGPTRRRHPAPDRCGSWSSASPRRAS